MDGIEKLQPTDTNIDYRQKMFDDYGDSKLSDGFDIEIDDSFVYEEDKINLFDVAKHIVNTKYKSYPYPMNEVLIQKIYNDCIKNLNKEEYLKEKEEMDEKNILHKNLSKIDKFSGI
jgi:hypothetical protein